MKKYLRMYIKKGVVTLLVGSVVLLTACNIGIKQDKNVPPYLFITERQDKVAYTGTHSWVKNGEGVSVDKIEALKYDYNDENTLILSEVERIPATFKDNIYTPSKITTECFSTDNMETPYLLEDGQMMDMNGRVYLRATDKPGEYIYVVTINFGENGKVEYGFKANVVNAEYHIKEMLDYKTPYIGNGGNVGNLVSYLPTLSGNLKQRFISLDTEESPYGLHIYYEPNDLETIETLPNLEEGARAHMLGEAHSYVLFSMIDNLDIVTMHLRREASGDELVEKAYDISMTFDRNDLEKKYNIEAASEENIETIEKTIEKILK